MNSFAWTSCACAIAAAVEGCDPGPGGGSFAPAGVATAASGASVEARLLVVTPGGGAAGLAALRQELEQIGTLYAVVDTSVTPLSVAMLADGATHGLWNGIVLATCAAGAGPDAATDALVAAYARQLAVRTACLGAPADQAHGFGLARRVDTRAMPLTLRYTAGGAALFGSYANTSSLPVSGVTVDLGPALDAATTPLLVDDDGNAAVAIRGFPDGREMLMVTFDQPAGSMHSMQLLYGVVGWVTRGVFIGEKRAYLNPQVDDLFMGTVTSDGAVYRMSGADLQNAARWQQQVQATAVGAGIRLTFPFNGAEVADADDLTQAARAVGQQFMYVSHTYDHHRLDAADGARMIDELTSNDQVMQKYAFGLYERSNLVTPDVSGLANGAVMLAASQFGIRNIVCDGSQATCKPATFNTGLANPLAPALFMIPRIATNLYANVSTAAQWVSGFNALNRASIGRDLAIDEIMERESNTLLGYVLSGNIDPTMYHQTNLRAYAGSTTLLTELLDSVLARYEELRVLPIISLPMEEIGRRMQDRAQLGQAGLSATIGPGNTITLRATQAVRVPITGARADGAEQYGSQMISRVDVPAGGSVTVPLAGGDGTPGAGGAPTSSGTLTVSHRAGAGQGHGGCAVAPAAAERPASGPGAAAQLAAAAAILAAARRRARTVTGRA